MGGDPMIRRSSLGICFGAVLSLLACEGGTTASGSGGASPGTGGASATGGAQSGSGGEAVSSGGASGSGPDGSGGATPSGGITAAGGEAATGGTSSGTGGEGAAGPGWDEVRCWQFQGSTYHECWGRLGNLWGSVGAVACLIGAREPMSLNEQRCSAEDDSTGWDETWCVGEACMGRLGGWYASLQAECEITPLTPYDGTPAELYCGETEEPAGWDNLQCFFEVNDSEPRYCPGSHGIYYVAGGLVPTCALEAELGDNEDYVEVTADPEYCD